tara:strand:- start:502 stop:1233 length:732 start_codon:yes stop_codon:yes gene_type:complete
MNLIKLLKHKNHPNILLYNLYDNKIIIDALNVIHDITPNIIITRNDISYIKTNIYHIFNIDKIQYVNKSDFINIIKDVIDQNIRYIIFNNLENNASIQNILKVIIEKNTHTKFIIISNKFSNIIKPIKSRFLSICFPNTNKNIINKYKRHIFDYIFNLYYDTNLNIIKNIKYISYILRCINDNFTIFLKELFEYIFDRIELTIDIKCKCIYLISDIEYKYNKGYYKILYYEYILLKIYTIIKT